MPHNIAVNADALAVRRLPRLLAQVGGYLDVIPLGQAVDVDTLCIYTGAIELTGRR